MPSIDYSSNQPIPAFYPPSILGRRFSYQGKVYLADPMGMRWITNPTVYNALFRDWNGITALTNPPGSSPCVDVEGLMSYLRSGTADYQLFMRAPQGSQITEGAALMKDPAAPEVYLVEPAMKRHIVSPDIMEQYSFNWNAIQVVEAATLAALKTGPVLDAKSSVDLTKNTPMYVTFGLYRRDNHINSAS
jgi:hypothetical protein